MINTRYYRIKLVLFGIVLSFLLLELFLGILSRMVSRRHYNINLPSEKDSYNILCIGDSYTYGIGAKSGYTYPEQLGRLLKDKYPEDKFRVINAGVPGFNTSEMSKELSENIDRYSPDLIIVWGGVDNCWNFTDTNYFIFTGNKIDSNVIFRRLDSFLLKFRSYKMLKISEINLANRTRNSYFPTKNQEKLLEAARIYIEKSPQDKSVILNKLKMAYDVDKNPEEAIILLKRYYPWEEFSEMVVDFFKLIKDKEALDMINKTGIYESYFNFNINNKDRTAFDKLLKYDLEKMIAYAKAKNIKIILLTYPTDTMERGGDNFIIRLVAEKHNVPCVDFAPLFAQLLKKEKTGYYFVSGGHFNDNGYKVVAQEIYKKFKSDIYTR